MARLGALLQALGCAAQDAEHFILFHDQVLFAVELDFAAGVLAEENVVAFLNVKREGLALFVLAALAHGDDFALLRFVLGGIGNDDAAASGVSFFQTTHQDAVVQGSELCCHSCAPSRPGGTNLSFRIWVSWVKLLETLGLSTVELLVST